MRRGGNEEKVEREERHCLVWQLVESGWTIRSYQIQRYREGGGRKEEADKPRSPSFTLLIPSSSPHFSIFDPSIHGRYAFCLHLPHPPVLRLFGIVQSSLYRISLPVVPSLVASSAFERVSPPLLSQFLIPNSS